MRLLVPRPISSSPLTPGRSTARCSVRLRRTAIPAGVENLRRPTESHHRYALMPQGPRLAVLGGDLDQADDVRVQLVEIFGRYPVLQDRATADLLDWVSGEEG